MIAKILLMGLLGTGIALAQGDPVKAFDPAAAAVRKPGTTVRIDLIGDSTQTDNAGYGRGFCANLSAKVDCVNMAKGGASTRSFRSQGLWERSLQTKPDYMLIQFGHNDVVFNRPPAANGARPAEQHRLRLRSVATARLPTQATTKQTCASTLRRLVPRGSSLYSSRQSRGNTLRRTARFIPTRPNTASRCVASRLI